MANRIHVLLSGGVDSSCLLPFYLNQGRMVEAVHFDYGQPVAARELTSAQDICRHYSVDLSIKTIRPCFSVKEEVVGRNAFFTMAIAMSINTQGGIISMGIHSGSPYYDCSPHFVDQINKLVGGCSSGLIEVQAPFLSWNKLDIYQFASANDVPIHLTYSCERTSPVPCGKCSSCKDMEIVYDR